MNRNTLTQIVAVILMLACLGGAAGLAGQIDHYRRSEKFMRGAPVGTLPPMLEVSRAFLATFRGLAIDVMWYRANRLKEEGRYHEINDLSEMITSLQPRFAQVWVFQAWNMAYNISVATHTPAERWDWVNKGIKLLRERAIVYNPEQPKLYKELNWIFFHKIGAFSDDMNWYYKQELALEWQEILGAPIGETTAEVLAQFRKVAEAPASVRELLAAHPGADAILARLAALPGAHDLRDPRIKREEIHALMRRVGQPLMAAGSEDAELFGQSFEQFLHSSAQGESTEAAQILAIFHDRRRSAQAKADADAVLAYLRRATIEQQYRMDVKRMLECMETFGPMDWRHAASHAIYWTELGLDKTRNWPDAIDPDLLNSYRGTIHGTQELAYRGRISFDPVTRRMDLLPDPRFIEAYEKGYLAAWAHAEKTERAVNIIASFEGGYENFLIRATIESFLYGDDEQAEAYYEKLRDKFADKIHNLQSRRYDANMHSFVQTEMAQHFEVFIYSRQFIDGMLNRAFAHGLANGRMDVFRRYVELAHSAHELWQKYQTLDGRQEPEDRLALLPWDQLVAVTYAVYMQDSADEALRKARIWRYTPLPLQQAVFDEIKPYVYQQAQAAMPPLAPEVAFNEPPDMEEYRANNPPLPMPPKAGRQTIERR